ncbi:MAG: type II toxin-antitoxin system RelE/ParE family toxin [Burkholderiales bacterium]|nr:type II toxin-antitoxin system RelE/ParE family toxin [Burkholderiales bacterium]
MKPVRYLDEARDEFLHEVEYFAALSPRLGRRFDEAVRRAEALVSEFPDLGTPYKYGTRRVLPGRFRFSLVYLVRELGLVILAVAPFKRRPGYWRSRVVAAGPGGPP